MTSCPVINYRPLNTRRNTLRSSHATAGNAGRLFEDVEHRFRGALAHVDCRKDGGLVSVSMPLPEVILGPYLPDRLAGYYWSRASSDLTLLGTGVAARLVSRGTDRMGELSRQFAAIRTRWIRSGAADAPVPAAFLGFAFSPDEEPGPEWHGLANAEIVVPELQYRRHHDASWITFTAPTGGGFDAPAVEKRWLECLESLVLAQQTAAAVADPPVVLTRVEDGDWNAPLDQALADIREGSIDKVVLTRRVRYSTSRALRTGRVLNALREGQEDSARFAVSRPGFALLGVSPERLVSLDQDVVVADALAGTAPRGATAALDATLAARLRQDPKALQEHKIVVDQIQRALSPCCRGLLAPQAPEIMSLPTVHHLWSPVGGHLRNGCDLLELAERLHPTPAVGGSPRGAALEWLDANEKPGRGWYTGAFGWMDVCGNGELSVVLRCGILNGASVDLFAGAGIVADSRPDQEFAETEWKLCTMRGALELG